MCASMCLHGTVKVYDAATFDMIVMLRSQFVPVRLSVTAEQPNMY
jgi:hypothetical protein